MIAIEALSVEFGGVKALDSFTLTADTGEIVGIVGPNGAGKTTLLDAIGGAAAVVAGSIAVGGARLNGLPVHRIAAHGIARTHQAPRLFPHMTAIENVAAGTYLRRAPRAALEGDVRDALAVAGYKGSLSVPARELSESDRRRVELARAVVASPRLMLLDEPFAPLEQAEREVLRLRLSAFAAERKMTILIAERDIAECLAACDRVVVLHAGTKVAEGSPQAVARDPDVRDVYLGVEWRQ